MFRLIIMKTGPGNGTCEWVIARGEHSSLCFRPESLVLDFEIGFKRNYI